MCSSTLTPTLGIIGFGAFGRLMARHLAPHFALRAHDPAWAGRSEGDAAVRRSSLPEAASCDIVVLAVPVAALASVVAAVAPHLRPGTLVLDVGSVKIEPAAVLRAALPPDVDIVATHPLFGPQSAADGLAGLRIVLCPVRGRRVPAVSRFLRQALGLEVVVTTPDAHDRELATVQGLTHLVGRLVARMGPLPTCLTTRSFERLIEAVAMVTGDAPEVYDAILRANPHAEAVRDAFFGAAAKLAAELAEPPVTPELTARSPRSAMIPAWSSAPESAPSWCP